METLNSLRTGDCDTCGAEGELFMYALPGIPMSVANCRVCWETNSYPWWILVRNTALIGGIGEAADWWKEAVNTTLARLGKTQQEFMEAVKEDIKELADGN